MFKKKFKNYLPNPEGLKKNKSLRFLGTRIFDVSLWHFNRRYVSRAFLVGIFCAFLPMPFQMIPAAILAVYLRGNLPISVSLVWITNPLTMPIIFYFTYKVGCWILGIDLSNNGSDNNWQWLLSKLSSIWLPLYFGSIICGIFFAICGYFAVNITWKIYTINAWKKRRKISNSVKY